MEVVTGTVSHADAISLQRGTGLAIDGIRAPVHRTIVVSSTNKLLYLFQGI